MMLDMYILSFLELALLTAYFEDFENSLSFQLLLFVCTVLLAAVCLPTQPGVQETENAFKAENSEMPVSLPRIIQPAATATAAGAAVVIVTVVAAAARAILLAGITAVCTRFSF